MINASDIIMTYRVYMYMISFLNDSGKREVVRAASI